MLKPFIIAIDPGKMTGVCVVDTSGPTIIDSQELDEWEYNTWLNDTLSQYDHSLVDVVCEKFVITPQTHKNGAAPWSLEGTGRVKAFAQLYYGRDFVVKLSPTNAKTFSTNPKLRACGLWHKGGAGHANDALRHALHHMVECGWKDARLLGAK